MPLRIAIVATLTVAACMVVPLSVNAVSSSNGETIAENAEDPDPGGDSVPIVSSVYPSKSIKDIAEISANNASIHAAGYQGNSSGIGLLTVIIAALLPSLFMMARSSRRRRDGPIHTAGHIS